MSLNQFNIDIINAPETPDARVIRAQMRLSTQWRLSHIAIQTSEGEYSDDYPDIRNAVRCRDLVESDSGLIIYYISPVLKDEYRCPCCGQPAIPISYKTRRYKHVVDKGFQCMLAVNLPKLKCDNCGGTPQLRFPAADPGKSYTRPLAQAVIAALRSKTKSAVAKEFYLHTDTVDAILNDAVKSALSEQDLSYVTGVYVDETQFGHGQDYISVFVDQRHKVIFMCKGHSQDSLELFRDHLIVQGGDPESIRFFSADMSRAYEAGITKLFPNADLVWDRFHLAKAVNEAVNNIRKQLIRRNKDERLSLTKYIFLRHEKDLTDAQADRLREIRLTNPEMALAYDMKEAFLEIMKINDPDIMLNRLFEWVEWVKESGHEYLKKKAKTFCDKFDRIVAWTRHPVSNSVCEGINKNIQDARRQAYGYKSVNNFYSLIFLRQGDLTFRF